MYMNTMRIKDPLLVALAVASLGLGGCGKDESADKQSGKQVQEPAPQPVQVGQPPSGVATQSNQPPATTAPQTTASGQTPSPTTPQQDFANQLQDLQQKIDELQQKASQGAEQTKASLKEQLDDLKRQRHDLEQKASDVVNDAAAAGTKKINDLFGKLNRALDDVTRSVDRQPPEEPPATDAKAPATGGSN
jgi:hypothetical protein